MRYKPWGEVRYNWTATQVTTPAYTLAKFTFTGQYSYMDDPSTSGVTEGFGLMFYNARWYDPTLGRFAQADSIVPPGVQGLDRYAYVNNSPMNYVDPSGHAACDDEEGVCSGNPSKNKPSQGGLPSGNWGDGGSNGEDEQGEEGDDYKEYILPKAQIHELVLYYKNLSDAMWYVTGSSTIISVFAAGIGVPTGVLALIDAIASNNIADFFSAAEIAAENTDDGNLTIKLYSNGKDLDPKSTGMPTLTFDGSGDFTEIWSFDLTSVLQYQLENPNLPLYDTRPVYVR